MDEEKTPERKSNSFSIGEDWWAVIVGLGLTALVGLGIITRVPWPISELLR